MAILLWCYGFISCVGSVASGSVYLLFLHITPQTLWQEMGKHVSPLEASISYSSFGYSKFVEIGRAHV